MAALIVATLGGGCILTADNDDATFETVSDLKLAIQDRHGIRRFQQRLMLGERILDDDATVAALGGPPLRVTLVTLPYHEDNASTQALEDAIEDGMLGQVRRLLQLPVNPNIRGKVGLPGPPIFNEARRGDPKVAGLLIEAEADPNARGACFGGRHGDLVDCRPLHVAVQHPDGAVVQTLCRARAEVNAVHEEGDTPLLDAVRHRHFDVVRLLASARANLDYAPTADDCGNTALQRAAWKGDEEGVRVLLHLGANTNLPDREGWSVGLGWRRPSDAVAPGSAGRRRWRPPITAGARHAEGGPRVRAAPAGSWRESGGGQRRSRRPREYLLRRPSEHARAAGSSRRPRVRAQCGCTLVDVVQPREGALCHGQRGAAAAGSLQLAADRRSLHPRRAVQE